MMLRAAACLLLASLALSAQDRVSPEVLYHRVWAVVPLIGRGTPDDPRRPMFVPSPSERAADARSREKTGAEGEKIVERPAIVSYSMQISDDGKSALVEFSGPSPAALKHIAESRAPGVRAFERGKATKEEIEAEFAKHKQNFKLETLSGGVR